MQRKPHTRILLAVVVASLAAGVGCDKLRARDKLNKGVQAYKGGQTDLAIEDFKTAKELDPKLTNARLYLATAYSAQYIPGAPSDENVRNGNQAEQEFKDILTSDPDNLSAIDGLGSILYNMGGTPFDPKKFEESKTYHEQHINCVRKIPSPTTGSASSIGRSPSAAIAICARTTTRRPRNLSAMRIPCRPRWPLNLRKNTALSLTRASTDLQKAIQLRPDYDDAMAYLNLLYRQKADMETDPAARDADTKLADELVEKVKAIKQQKLQNPQPSS